MSGVREIQFAEYGTTNLHPLAFVFVVVTAGVTLTSRRSAAILAVLSVCVFMPTDQRIVIFDLDFSMLRLIMLVAWLRVFARREYRGFRLEKLDRMVLLWVLSASFFYVLRVGAGGVVYRLGYSFDVLTAFFLIRILLRTRVQLLEVWRGLAGFVIVLAPFLVYEVAALHNPFGIFSYSGIGSANIDHDGRVRAQGPFSHPILAGTFAAAAVPVFIGILKGQKRERKLFALACVAATAIVVAAGSSGPVVTWAVSLLGWGLWRLRRHMRQILGVAVLGAVVLHLVREKPVWHLIGRLSSITGGHGYHRYRLMDAFINRFTEWALVGTDNTASWGWGLQDTTNQYVGEGIDGGVVTLFLFIVVLRMSFVQLRAARSLFERMQRPGRPWALLAWGLSVSLAAHCVSFMSVSYFGQMVPFFAMFLATVPAMARFRRPRPAESRESPVSAKVPRNAVPVD